MDKREQGKKMHLSFNQAVAMLGRHPDWKYKRQMIFFFCLVMDARHHKEGSVYIPNNTVVRCPESGTFINLDKRAR